MTISNRAGEPSLSLSYFCMQRITPLSLSLCSYNGMQKGRRERQWKVSAPFYIASRRVQNKYTSLRIYISAAANAWAPVFFYNWPVLAASLLLLCADAVSSFNTGPSFYFFTTIQLEDWIYYSRCYIQPVQSIIPVNKESRGGNTKFFFYSCRSTFKQTGIQ